MKPIGPQLRQRLLKGADKPVKGVGFAGAEGQRDPLKRWLSAA
jgi:hypothetical protein